MTNEEAMKYLIRPIVTSTGDPRGEVKKQLEAYEMARDALNKKCNLCEYRKNPEICRNIVAEGIHGVSTWHCPTLSNYYYGHLIYIFPFNLIFKIQVLIWEHKLKRKEMSKC